MTDERLAYAKSYREGLKRKSFAMYGGAFCVLCEENQFEFLTLDHVGNSGFSHRKVDAGAQNIHIWLRKNDYPLGFRVLCFNCNMAESIRLKRETADEKLV